MQTRLSQSSWQQNSSGSQMVSQPPLWLASVWVLVQTSAQQTSPSVQVVQQVPARTQALPQGPKPLSHWMPQTPSVQVGLPLAGSGQSVQVPPVMQASVFSQDRPVLGV